MGFLTSGNNNPNNYVPYYAGLQIQTAGSAIPIAIVYGSNKIAPNAFWTGGYYGYWYSGNGSSNKGSSNSGSGHYEYHTSFMMGLCEGPIKGISTVWKGNQITNTFSAGIWTIFKGTTTQNPWGILNTYFASQALAYRGLAYITSYNYDLGSTPTLPQYSFEVNGILDGSAGFDAAGNHWDADPAQIIQDFLTSAQYGVGFPSASIDLTTLLGSSGDSSYQTYCSASFIAMSPALTNQETANSILSRWLKLTNSTAVWSGGKLKFIPYGDVSVTGAAHGSPVTFNPNVTPIYNLDDDDFINEDGKDPLEVIRSDPFESYNWLRLNMSQRRVIDGYGDREYRAIPIDVWDQNAIELYGLRMGSDISANEICDSKTAQIIAQLILQRQLYVRNTYRFKLSFEYCLLEPMDLVTVTDAAVGLNNVTVRITSIEEGTDGLLDFTAEEFPGGLAALVAYPTGIATPNSTNKGVIPARVNDPIIFEPPAKLTGGLPSGSNPSTPPNGAGQLWVALSGGVSPVFKLSEDGSTGVHSTTETVVSVQASGVSITFTTYAQAVDRSAIRLNLYNGSATIGCDFDLSAGVTGTPDAGITEADIGDAGGGWWQISITALMATSGTPVFTMLLESVLGTTSYAGASGHGVLIWAPGYAANTEATTFLPAFSSVTGATLPTNGAAPPSGVVGNADQNWGGAFVWLSTDGTTYNQIGLTNSPAKQGYLTASLAAPSANPDVTNTLSVNLIESGGVLSSVAAADAANGASLCLIDGELLAYETATLTGTNAYDLTTLYRGFYDTTPAAHSNGAKFTYIDDSVFTYTLPASLIGVPIYLKFQSFNVFGLAVEDLSECTVYNYTPSGASAFGLAGSGSNNDITAINQQLQAPVVVNSNSYFNVIGGNGAQFIFDCIVDTINTTSGTTVDGTKTIPANAIVFGVGIYIISTVGLSGGATKINVGANPGSATLYATGYSGLTTGTSAYLNVPNNILTTTAASVVRLTASGGLGTPHFSGGSVRIALFYCVPTPPTS